jgi:hypothetical protein
MRILRHIAIAVSILLGVWPTGASAQQRPLVTEDPETIGAGRVLIEGGIDYGRSVQYPTSGLQGHLLRVPLLGVSVGISSIAEIQIDGGLYNRLTITSRDLTAPFAGVVTAMGDRTTSVEDLVIGTKIRLVSEGVTRPSFGFRVATRLPNASRSSGIGVDTTDFFASLLAAKTAEQVRVVGNIGLGILTDPAEGNRQNDVLTYGLSVARAVTHAAEFVGEINGRLSTSSGTAAPGTESRSVLRVGARYTVGAWRADAAVLFGIATPDPSIGVAAGFTYVFDAFRVP